MAVDADPGIVVRHGGPASSRAAASAPTLVRSLVTVPGATYAAVVDERSGALLAESGSAGSAATPSALLSWVRRATRRPGPGSLDDLVVTTDRAFHVLRRRPSAAGTVWAYLRVDRRRGNLALARRAAGAAGPTPALAPVRPSAPHGPATRTGLPKRPPTALPGPRRTAGARPWPRPAAAVAPPPGLPAPATGWSADTDTLRRLLTGLQRLA